MNADAVTIAGRPVGPGNPPYVVAEMSGNHKGDLGRALALVDAAHAAGADAVKLQTYTADTITLDHDGPEFRITSGLWSGRTLHDLYAEAATPWDWHEALFARGAERGITVFSSPFDVTAVEMLERLDAPAYKIASFEAIDLPLIERTAATGRPVIVSTGMATEEEIADAVGAARRGGSGGLVLLHCVSAYPARPRDSNLRRLADLADRFGVVAGLSDHTPGTVTAIAATALGAAMIEKHVTLARADGGPDAAFSLEPDELGALVRDVRAAWESLGNVIYGPTAAESDSVAFRRSLYAVADIAVGETLGPGNVRSIRPGRGLAPKHLPEVLGRRAKVAISRGTPLAWELVE